MVLDGSFLHACTKYKLDLYATLSRLLQDEVKLFTCSFVVNELKKLGLNDVIDKITSDDIRILKTKKELETVEVDKGILKIVGERNDQRFVVATQDVELRKRLRQIPGVPLIYLNRAVPVLEKQSQASVDFQNGVEQKKRAPKKWERRKLHEDHTRNAKRTNTSSGSSKPSRKRKGPKGPNPLSVLPKRKKLKKAEEVATATSPSPSSPHKKKKKKRRKKKKKSGSSNGETTAH